MMMMLLVLDVPLIGPAAAAAIENRRVESEMTAALWCASSAVTFDDERRAKDCLNWEWKMNLIRLEQVKNNNQLNNILSFLVGVLAAGATADAHDGTFLLHSFVLESTWQGE